MNDYIEQDELLDLEERTDKVSFDKWIQYPDGRVYPSQSATMLNKLTSGLYKAIFDRDKGMDYLIKLSIKTDDLLDLGNSDADMIFNECKQFWNSKDIYEHYKFVHKRGILMMGAPGTGKTSIINKSLQWFLENIKGVAILITNEDELASYCRIHKTVFRSIETDRPMTVIMEDIDNYIGDSYNVSKILNILDGFDQVGSVMHIATTNSPEKLPTTLTERPGRFDIKLEISNPNHKERKKYILEKIPTLTQDELKNWIDVTQDMSMAYLGEMVKQYLIYKLPFDKIKDNIRKFDEVAESSHQFNKRRKAIGFSNG